MPQSTPPRLILSLRAIPPVCSLLPVTLAPRQLWDMMLCSVVGCPQLPPSHDTAALLLSQGQNVPMRREEGSKGAGKEGKDASGPWADRHRSEKQRWRPPALLAGAPQDTETGSRQDMELSTGVFTQGVAS